MKKHILFSSLLMAYAGISIASEAPAEAAPSMTVEQKAATCAACHGPAGISTNPAFPTIAGQHRSYLQQAMEDYRSGAREDAVMAAQAASLTDAEIKALSIYFSKQLGPLYTPTGD